MITRYLDKYDPLLKEMLVKDKMVAGIQFYIKGEDMEESGSSEDKNSLEKTGFFL